MRLGPAAFIAAMTAVSVPAFAQTPTQSEEARTRTASVTADDGQQGSASTNDSLDKWTLNATLEGFYEYNWNRPPDRANTLRIYDTRANTFGIQQAALVVESAPDRKENRPFGLRLDLQFGQATESTQGSSLNEPRPDAYRYVWQAYGSYVFPGSRRVQVDFGKFASNFSYETTMQKTTTILPVLLYFPSQYPSVSGQVTLNDRVTLLRMLTNGVRRRRTSAVQVNQFAAVGTREAYQLTIPTLGQEQPLAARLAGPMAGCIFDTTVTYAPTGQLSVGRTPTARRIRSEGISHAHRLCRLYGISPSRRASLRTAHLDDSGGLFGGVPGPMKSR
jgi:hypothetical protein